MNKPLRKTGIHIKIRGMPLLKQQTNKAKARYEAPTKKNASLFYKTVRTYEPAYAFRSEVHKKTGAKNVSGAWLKAYEMFSEFDIFDKKHIRYFDNAAFPGSFILAAHHYVTTMTDAKFEWFASSLMDDDALQDKYGLYQNYNTRWMMDKKNNGDVTSLSNQKAICEKMGNSIDVYTSDLGFDVSSDYNEQEALHAHANLGQIITGLLVLKKGGHMITKQYSAYSPFTISIIGVLNKLFDQVYISKPLFSKMGNSESYLVCKNYKNNIHTTNVFIHRVNIKTLLFEKLEHMSLTPIFPSIPRDTMNDIARTYHKLAMQQIQHIDAIINAYENREAPVFDTRRDLRMWRSKYPLRKVKQSLSVNESIYRKK